MAVRKKKRVKKKPVKRFRFQLSLAGVAGVGVVVFCLFLWMFLLGIWAGQTILLPSSTPGQARAGIRHVIPEKQKPPVGIIVPEGKKRSAGK